MSVQEGGDAGGAREAGATITLDRVCKTYPGGVEALRNVTEHVDAGGFVAIVGPSGCGKSTLLRALAGLEDITAGEIHLDGEPPMRMRRRHEIGIAFQDHALMPWLSVRDNIALPFRLSGLSVDTDRVEWLIELVGLGDFSKARPKHLSGGMRQRVAIARSIVLSPRLLLLDEPFGALDLVTRRILNFEMQQVWNELRATTVLVTHSVNEAVLLADAVMVMTQRPGRIVEVFEVPEARPRGRAFTDSDRFSRLVREVSAALDQAAGITSESA